MNEAYEKRLDIHENSVKLQKTTLILKIGFFFFFQS